MTVNVRDLGFDGARLGRVRKQLESDIEAERCHGASLIVARRGRIALEHVLGHADRTSGKKLGPDAVFTSLSVGKQFTSALVLGLVSTSSSPRPAACSPRSRRCRPKS